MRINKAKRLESAQSIWQNGLRSLNRSLSILPSGPLGIKEQAIGTVAVRLRPTRPEQERRLYKRAVFPVSMKPKGMRLRLPSRIDRRERPFVVSDVNPSLFAIVAKNLSFEERRLAPSYLEISELLQIVDERGCTAPFVYNRSSSS